MTMKLAWLFQREETDSWEFSENEPFWCYAKKQIAYIEIVT